MFTNKQILIIEDDDESGELIQTALEIQNARCIRSNKIGDSILKLENQRFNCILLDMNLAGGGKGEDLLAQMKSLKLKIPVLIVSGTLDNDRIKSVYKEVAGILLKPYTVDALIEKVEQVIS